MALHFMRELHVMMLCVMNSIWTLIWTCLFLAFSLLIAGLLFVQVMNNYRIDYDLPADLEESIEMWFGTVGRAMLIVLEGSTGGIAWGIVHDVVRESGTRNSGLFLAVIIFFRFAFLSIVTSIFVDKAKKLGQPDEEEILLDRQEDEHKVAQKLHSMFARLDGDQDGHVSLEEIQLLCNDPSTRFFFELHGIGIKDVEAFFQELVDSRGSNNRVEISILVDACMKVKGHATSLDVQLLMAQMSSVVQAMQEVTRSLAAVERRTALGPADGSALCGPAARAHPGAAAEW